MPTLALRSLAEHAPNALIKALEDRSWAYLRGWASAQRVHGLC